MLYTAVFFYLIQDSYSDDDCDGSPKVTEHLQEGTPPDSPMQDFDSMAMESDGGSETLVSEEDDENFMASSEDDVVTALTIDLAASGRLCDIPQIRPGTYNVDSQKTSSVDISDGNSASSNGSPYQLVRDGTPCSYEPEPEEGPEHEDIVAETRYHRDADTAMIDGQLSSDILVVEQAHSPAHAGQPSPESDVLVVQPVVHTGQLSSDISNVQPAHSPVHTGQTSSETDILVVQPAHRPAHTGATHTELDNDVVAVGAGFLDVEVLELEAPVSVARRPPKPRSSNTTPARVLQSPHSHPLPATGQATISPPTSRTAIQNRRPASRDLAPTVTVATPPSQTRNDNGSATWQAPRRAGVGSPRLLHRRFQGKPQRLLTAEDVDGVGRLQPNTTDLPFSHRGLASGIVGPWQACSWFVFIVR